MMEILVVDDERIVREGLSIILKSEGYRVRTAVDGASAQSEIARSRPDLILLDVMLPGKNGYVVCREIRSNHPDLPVLFLTAKDAEGDELRGFGVGADDYLSKTVSDSVLLARIAAILRRTANRPTSEGFEFGDSFVDTSRQTISSDGAENQLSLREIEILRWFSEHPGEVFSIDFLLTRFWGVNADLSDGTIHMMIRRLREKLGCSARRLTCVRSQGYVYSP